MSDVPKVILVPRSATVGRLVDQCAAKELTFDALCMLVAAMGYKTTGLYEMVIAREQELKHVRDTRRLPSGDAQP